MDNQFKNENDYDKIKQSDLSQSLEKNRSEELVNSNQQNYKYQDRKLKNEKKREFNKGVILGLLFGILGIILTCSMLIAVMYRAGYIHIGVAGDVYVQDTAVNDSDGIGSEIESKLNTLDSVLDTFYFDDVDKQKAEDDIYKAYLNAYGDKYTVYYTTEEYSKLLESTNGKFYGIGAGCQKQEDGTILITSVYENSPAYRAGIEKGDCLYKVEDTDITDMDLSSAVALIRGDKGTKVKLSLKRNGEDIICEAVRDEINVKTVSYIMQENNIGYIRISEFDKVTTTQFKEALDDLNSQGMQGLIIDIRSNPGGVLGTVVNMLDEILPEGLIVYTEDKFGKRAEYKGSNKNQIEIPMAVLVNENSASASEIFAGAVQDYGVGKIIGMQTFGKGIVQTIKPLTDGSAIKYTIAKYFTPKGQDIHGHGVTPDQIVDLVPDENGMYTVDNQMQAAVDYLKGEINK